VFDEQRYPNATRVGHRSRNRAGSAYDPDVAYRFGLDRTIYAIQALVGSTTTTAHPVLRLPRGVLGQQADDVARAR
jgi:hypothetical protein